MAEVKVSETIEAPADAVWALVRDFGGVDKWAGPALESCAVEGEGIGAVRRIRGAGGLRIVERLEALDEAARSLSYSLIEERPIPVKDYLATIRIEELGPGRCRVDWSSTFEPDGAPAEQGRAIVTSVYTGGIQGLRKALGV